MGFILDEIVKKQVIGEKDQNGNVTYETINTDGSSEIFEVDRTENNFKVQLEYANGSTVNITFIIEGSVDGQSFAAITDSDQVIIDDSGTIIWDISDVSPNYARVSWTVTSGSLDIFAQFSGDRRH